MNKNQIKVLGKVDLSTGKIYNLKGQEVTMSKPEPLNLEELKERLERRRAWLSM